MKILLDSSITHNKRFFELCSVRYNDWKDSARIAQSQHNGSRASEYSKDKELAMYGAKKKVIAEL